MPIIYYDSDSEYSRDEEEEKEDLRDYDDYYKEKLYESYLENGEKDIPEE